MSAMRCATSASPSPWSARRSAWTGSRALLKHEKRSRHVRDRRRGVAVRAEVFDRLSERLEGAWKTLKGEDKITPENIKEPLKEIRRALLEADVSLPVVRSFVKRVEASAVGTGVVQGVKPDQQLVKCVYDELLDLLGSERAEIQFETNGPTVIVMAGLQGVGKTTACGKLAKYLKKQGKNVLMVATDVYRPAAVDQLVTVGKSIDVPVFEMGTSEKPVNIARKGVEEAQKSNADVVIVDTAGRLQINQDMMDELQDIRKAVKPTETLLVVDAMTGQEAAGLVKTFNDACELTGAILTKLDGDSRGGAALSIREVSGKPIKFVGLGEKLDALEPFYPERLVGRILGMGDVLTLVEKAQETVDAKEAERMQQRILEAKFDFNDFLKQSKMVANMGNMGQLMKMLPGMGKISDKALKDAESMLKVFESMINSMTPEERSKPELLASSPSRRRRVAKGSGRSEVEVSNLLQQFSAMRSRMQSLTKMMQNGGNGMPAGMGQMSEEEMMKALGAGQKRVSPNKVKRKKGTGKGKGFAAAKGFGK